MLLFIEVYFIINKIISTFFRVKIAFIIIIERKPS